MRFPKTIRLDSSDRQVFERAAEPNEWAVSGAFAFADADPSTLTTKRRQAFRNGFLGTASFGWSTLVAVAKIEAEQYQSVIDQLAAHFVERYGAPSLAAAVPAARAEAEFAAGLCDHQINTLLSVGRDGGDDGIVEQFRVIQPPLEPVHAKIWEIVEDDDEDG